MVEFHVAEEKDAPILAAIRRKAWDATYRGIYPDEMIDCYDLARFTVRDEKRIANPENKVWLVMDGADCVGYLVVGPCGFGRYKDFVPQIMNRRAGEPGPCESYTGERL